MQWMKPPSLTPSQAPPRQADSGKDRAPAGRPTSPGSAHARVRCALGALRVSICLISGVLLGTPAQAQYKWIDAQGSVHYSDLPPPSTARSLARQVGSSGPPGASSSSGSSPAVQDAGAEASRLKGLPSALIRVAQGAPVVLYAIAACVPCDEGRGLLQERGVPYTERRIDTAQDQQALQSLGLPPSGFPILSVGTERAVGYESGLWHRLLDHAGYPARSALPAHWRAAPARNVSTLIDPGSAPRAGPRSGPESDPRVEPSSEARTLPPLESSANRPAPVTGRTAPALRF
jgi:hypothetical protein